MTRPDPQTTQSPLSRTIKSWEVALRTSFGRRIDTPLQRSLSRIHVHLFDHEFVRIPWTNFAKVSEGVYRSNQPTRPRLRRMKAMGIRTIINLRGAGNNASYLFEEETARELGIALLEVPLNARRAPKRERLLELIEMMRRAERPMLMHCKSGADRAGLASAIYQIVFDGVPVSQAAKQLDWRFIHLKSTATGICDHLLEVYRVRNARSPIGFEDWIRTEYDARALSQSFAKNGWRLTEEP